VASNFCENCGKAIAPQAKFCPNCGASVSNYAADPAPPPLNSETAYQQEFSGFQDAPAKSPYDVNYLGDSDPAPKKRGAKLALIIVGSIAAFFILVVAVVLFAVNGTANADYYHMGKDQISSVKKVVGKRPVTNVGTGVSSVGSTYTVTYSEGGKFNQQQDLAAYLNYLRNNEGFAVTGDGYDLNNPSGVAQLAKKSLDDGQVILLNVDYGATGFTLNFSKRVGTLKNSKSQDSGMPAMAPDDTGQAAAASPEPSPEPSAPPDNAAANAAAPPDNAAAAPPSDKAQAAAPAAPDSAGNGSDTKKLARDEPGYAEMPESYGKSRNLNHYTVSDAGDATYENFLKLKPNMSLSDVKALFPGVKADEYFKDKWVITSAATEIGIFITNDKLLSADYHDDYRVCVNESDISMAKFQQLDIGMTLDEIKAILGANGYISQIGGAITSDGKEVTWFSEAGEITAVFNKNDKGLGFAQYGLQYKEDARAQYPVLTERQLLDNFAGAALDITYDELEKQMNNYIPLKYTTVNMNHSNVEDHYEFNRTNEDGVGLTLDFVFDDGKLSDKNAVYVPMSLMPATDVESANKVKEDMSYDEVKALLGEGYETEERYDPDGSVQKVYQWKLPGRNNFVVVTISDGKVWLCSVSNDN